MSDKKVILISIDGVRADGLLQCGNPYVDELKKIASYSFNARSVFPSVTLPCHLSIFHSVPPERHGTLSNTYVTPVRPVSGLFEQISSAGKKSAMFYGWQTMREVCRCGNLIASEFRFPYFCDHVDGVLTDKAIEFTKEHKPDFMYLYMPETDDKGGHDAGWMSETYLYYVSCAFDNVKRVVEAFGDEYTIVVTTDHGGHDRAHGSDMPEDMTIPMFFIGDEFEKGKELENISLLDIAPTIADVMGVIKPREWEGRSLINK